MGKSSTISINAKQYKNSFKNKEEKALIQAVKNRELEINLYWKRATYFWTFIAATFAGYSLVQTADNIDELIRQDLSVALSCMGVVFSMAWVYVNKGSKFWQENWENHVGLLENKVMGPLFKTVLSRNPKRNCKQEFDEFLTGPAKYSVSKINLLISFYIFIFWILLLLHSLGVFMGCELFGVNLTHLSFVILSIITAIMFFLKGKSYGGGFYHEAMKKKSRINPNNN